ncbi:MAG TPA: winged helix-turn-helix domain-containing protein [Candidatus Limicola stercorigallinarum]|nr:winged helix-turn-helix domain-containing protein [Candidatus Limicola stercorigallinarum]
MRLKDIKKNNRSNVMSAILKHESLSRIEIAHETNLSPSTVSGLVSGLIDEGYLVETGARTITAGRSRVELAVNKDLGTIAVVEIARTQVRLALFDVALGELDAVVLSHDYTSGNDLFALILAGINALANKDGQSKLLGMGLLFQRDMDSSEFNVMYSTGIHSANIPLATALFTQLRIPVIEEYVQDYTASRALERMQEDHTSGAYISLGEDVLATVVVQGAPVHLKNGAFANLAPLMEGVSAQTESALAPAESNQHEIPEALVAPERLAYVVSVLCALFPLDMVVFSGPQETMTERFISATERALHRCLNGAQAPWLEWLHLNGTGSLSATCADHVRRTILLQE